MRVEVIRAWADHSQSIDLDLPDAATVSMALAAVEGRVPLDDIAVMAVFGTTVTDATALRDGDRLELLRPLQADPKDARRIRARRAQGAKR